jgi:hypothetical protein
VGGVEQAVAVVNSAGRKYERAHGGLERVDEALTLLGLGIRGGEHWGRVSDELWLDAHDDTDRLFPEERK